MKDCPLPCWNQRVKPPRVAKRTGDLACNKQRTHILISSNIWMRLNGRNHQVNHESRPGAHSYFSFIEKKQQIFHYPSRQLGMLFGALTVTSVPRERSAQRTAGAQPSQAAPPYALVHAAVPKRSWEVGRYWFLGRYI